MEPLNDLERAVLALMLEGDDPLIIALRGQLAVVAVRRREYTGAGFLTYFDLPADTPPAPTESRVPRLCDVDADIEGLQHGAGICPFSR